MTNAMTLAAVATSARAKAVRLESELTARRFQFWMRLRARTGRRQTPSDRESLANEVPRREVAIMQSEKLDTSCYEPPPSGMRTFAEITALVAFAGPITVFVEYGIPFLIQ